MLATIKRHIPKPIKKRLKQLKISLIDNPAKKRLAKMMQKKHQNLLQAIKGKKKIRVVFLAIHKSVWKVDPVFIKMLADPFFEPIILVCPYTAYGDERMWQEMQDVYEYFESKGYPMLTSYNKSEQRWITLEELQPDLVFFTNPHKLTRKEYYEDAYLNYLSCYVPYHHEVGSYEGDIGQYGQPFHEAMWRIFCAHEASLQLYNNNLQGKAKNVYVTGFPGVENLLFKIPDKSSNVWCNDDSRIRLIWAPHHTINGLLVNQSTFIEYADFMIGLARKYQDSVYWCFKPHPILKEKLILRSDWGKARTNEYYMFWENSKFSQYNDGDYEELFLTSDSMIHDCGSFLAEYLYTKKPVMYLLSETHHGQFFNKFGMDALHSCEIGYSESDIINFIESLLNKKYYLNDKSSLINNYINKYYQSELPSDRILSLIKQSLSF